MNPDPVELSPEVKQKINELKEAGVLVSVIPSKEDDLFLLLIKGLMQSFTVAYFFSSVKGCVFVFGYLMRKYSRIRFLL